MHFLSLEMIVGLIGQKVSRIDLIRKRVIFIVRSVTLYIFRLIIKIIKVSEGDNFSLNSILVVIRSPEILGRTRMRMMKEV